MRKETLAAATADRRVRARQRIVKTAGIGLSGAALAALLGTGQSAAQYPTGSMPAPPAAAQSTVTIKGSGGVYRFSPRTLKVAKGKRTIHDFTGKIVVK